MATANLVLQRKKAYSPEGVGIGHDDNSKLDLGLRTAKTSFQRELAQKRLPKDFEGLVGVMLKARQDTLEGRYEMVCAYIALKKLGGNYYVQWGCKSLGELLDKKIGLPLGSTLAYWELLVSIFTRETYLVVGDELLQEMVTLVGWQTRDDAMRRRDYEEIFKGYRSKYGELAFDRQGFRDVMDIYIKRVYGQKDKPKGTSLRTTVVPIDRAEPIEPPTPTQPPALHIARPLPETPHVEVAPTPQDAPSIQSTVVVKEYRCGRCVERDEYIKKLERIISERLGESALPKRPFALAG